MTLTADSGSTKTTWVLSHDNNTRRFTTQGINPFHMTEERMLHILTEELIHGVDTEEGILFPTPSVIKKVHFYGAGCTKEKSPILKALLHKVFPSATSVEVASDMLGAAKALFGDKEGIACILGTGANSCLYDGKEIVENVSPMGYILGDEGSGAVLGKTFINLLYKGEHRDFIKVFEEETGLTAATIIQNVYREPMPNRFLASLAPFIHKHLCEPWIEEMVIDCFRLFFQRNIRHYNRPDLPCAFVGSIAYYFDKQLRIAAQKGNASISKVIKEPLS